LQQHSLAVGALARKIAKRLSLSPAEVGHAFVGGLLHDIGKLVLVTNYTEQYQEAMRRARASNIPIDQVESEMFGASHAEIGAYLLWLWGLPDPVAEILALHHHPSRDTEVAPAVAAVHFANALVNQESEQEMDLDCLRLKGLEAELPAWRQMRQEMLEGPPS
jgi:putative nucleotidyltransferase with HDIG domain